MSLAVELHVLVISTEASISMNDLLCFDLKELI